VDGSDVVAVYRVACEAITHARKGNGPTLIECVPYGLDSHLASSSPDARESEEPEGLIDKDPILNMEKYLAGKGLFAKNLRSKITASVRKELAAAIKAARKRLPV
jgi:TPP-dependent pyruvate/acetoin dehydrogenase alpha subunit